MAPKRGPRPLKGFLARIDPWAIIGTGAASSSSDIAPIGGSTPLILPVAPNSLEREGFGRAGKRPLDADTDRAHPLGERSDRPVVAPTKRGSFERASSATLSADDRSGALAALERDYYSSSSVK